jgi:hypothetical protein
MKYIGAGKEHMETRIMVSGPNLSAQGLGSNHARTLKQGTKHLHLGDGTECHKIIQIFLQTFRNLESSGHYIFPTSMKAVKLI